METVTAPDILLKLQNVKRNGTGWTARCPAHEDKHNSLSVSLGEDGRILLHDHAGCNVKNIVDALGMGLADLFPERSKVVGSPSRIERTYEYTDANGNLLYQVVRMSPKDFRQRRPDGRGGWTWNLQDVKRVLFCLPQVIKAVETGAIVYIVEGEKDVDHLMSLGFVATCNVGGAKKWRTEYGTFFKGAKVVVIPDNDEVGRTHAAEVARTLLSAAASVKMLELPGLPPHGDVSDWLQNGHTPDDLRRLVDQTPPIDIPAVAESASSSESRGRRDEWPKPVPLPKEVLTPVEAFEPEMLPRPFRRWVMDSSERMQNPPDFAAVGVMVGIASAIGKQIAIRPKRHDDWSVVPNLWGAIVGRPSVMKSPALLETITPLQRLEIRAKSDYEEACRTFEVQRVLDEERRKNAKRKVSKALTKGEDPDVSSLEEVLENEEDKPLRKRHLVNDSTVEKLGEILSANPNGVLVFRDELVGFLKSLDKDGREAERAFFLESWAGTGRFTYDRIGRGTIDIESACVSVLGGIQPGPLAEYLRGATKGGSGDDGLIQRFQLLVYPDVPSEWRNVDRWPDADARNEAYAVFARLAEIRAAELEAEFEDSSVPYLRFAPDAQEFFDEWREELEHRLRRGDEHPAIEAHLAKYRSLIPSLALIIHLVEGGLGAVSLATLTQATAWGEYLESHARRVYGIVLTSDVNGARTILKHIVKGELVSPFTARDVHRRGWTGLTTIEDVNQALELLLEHRILRDRTVQTGGKPRVEYVVSERIEELERWENTLRSCEQQIEKAQAGN